MANGGTSWFRRHRRPFIVFALILLCAVIYCVIVSFINPWSRLYNEEQELDLYSGKARFTHHVLYFQTRQDVSETVLSHATSQGGDQPTNEKWVKVNVFGFGFRQSPHFIYHGAFGQIAELEKYWDLGNFDVASRAKTARQLLMVWREGGCYSAAREYFELLMKGIRSRPDGQPTTVGDVSDDLADRAITAYNKTLRTTTSPDSIPVTAPSTK
ncbi:MAG: hypothetical protein HZA50_03520 [Planctomycetes bacterium]|nr:hypothetical protein [Planctomycetota bacterium]